MKFPNVRIEKEHLVSESDKGLALLDTGSPFTLNKDHPLMDGIRENTGLPLNTLVGMDILGGGVLLIDIKNHSVVVKEQESCLFVLADKQMKKRLSSSVPCVQTNIGWCAVDTGAMQSFVGDKGYTSSDIIETRDEFLPSGEKFKADIIECNVSIDGRDYKIKPAIMPKEYEGILKRWKVDSIIGLDILSKDKFIFAEEFVSPVVAFDDGLDSVDAVRLPRTEPGPNSETQQA